MKPYRPANGTEGILDLGKLSIGQRRDLLCDNTAWPTPYIDDMLRHLYPEEMHARNVRKRLKI
jgi:hypothetical protein